MRPVLAVQLCFALFQAFLFAPAQHVHETTEADHAGAHGHSILIHSHFSPHTAVPLHGAGPAITDHDEQEAWPLDTFTVVIPAGTHAAVPSPAPDFIHAPRPVVGVAVAVDERTHDPPARCPSIPRAPPA